MANDGNDDIIKLEDLEGNLNKTPEQAAQQNKTANQEKVGSGVKEYSDINCFHGLLAKRPIVTMTSTFIVMILFLFILLAFQARIMEPLSDSNTADAKLAERSTPLDILTVVFEAEDGNIIAPEKLKLINEIEQDIYNFPGMQEFCMLKDPVNKTCAPLMSINTVSPASIRTTSAQNWNMSMWCDGQGLKEPNGIARDYLGIGFDCAQRKARFTKSNFYIGGPLRKSTHSSVTDDFDNNNDRTDMQYQLLERNCLILGELHSEWRCHVWTDFYLST